MNEPAPSGMATQGHTAIDALPTRVTTAQIFREFLLIGATSFGGGVVAYLRNGLVTRRQWLDDKEFVELLSISQTLPGLNATKHGNSRWR